MLRHKRRTILLLVSLLVVFGTLLAVSLRMMWKAQDGTAVANVTTERLTVDGIPVVAYCNKTAGARPLVLVSHGLTGNRDTFTYAATVLAQMGFFVVTPDNWGHGERGGDGATIGEAIVKTAEDLDTLIDHYAQDERVDADRLGLIGFSMGGLVDYYYVANGNHRADLVGIICATPDWKTMTDNPSMLQTVAAGKATALASEAEKEAADQYLLANNPYDKVMASTGTVYYLLSGGQDPVIPLAGTQALYDALKDQGRAALVVDPDKGHDVSGENLSKLLEYFHDHLLADEPAQ